MSIERNIQNYSEILNLIGKWKIIDLSKLHKLILHPISYYTFKEKVRDLESGGFIKAKKYGSNRKFLYLTEKGFQHAVAPNKLIPNQYIFVHDLLVSEVIFEFLKYEKVLDGFSYPDIESSIIPDGLLIAEKSNEEFKIALEVELTQKAMNRVLEKFSQYGRSYDYDFVVFITNNERLANTYHRYLSEMENKIISKILIIFCPYLLPNQVELKDSTCFFKRKTVDFKDIFGENLDQQWCQSNATVNSRPDIIHDKNPPFTHALY